jgi:hypothetical protein
MATIAVFIALGGSSYAALRIGSADILDGSIRGVDVRPNALSGRSIAEQSLSRVPRARVAQSLTNRGAAALRLRCPSGTKLAAGACFESAPRSIASFTFAVAACGAANQGNRRLPTIAELIAFSGVGGSISPAGEFTSDVAGGDGVNTLQVVVVKPFEQFAVVSHATSHPYRCVTNPTNR